MRSGLLRRCLSGVYPHYSLGNLNRLDAITVRYPQVRHVLVISRCPYVLCLERIQWRYLSDPINQTPPERFISERKCLWIWECLDHLDRQDVGFVDALAPGNRRRWKPFQHLRLSRRQRALIRPAIFDSDDVRCGGQIVAVGE